MNMLHPVNIIILYLTVGQSLPQILCEIPPYIDKSKIRLWIYKKRPMSLPERGLCHISHLERINIIETNITSLDKQAFECMDILWCIRLSKCGLDHLPEGVFSQLPKLMRLELRGESIHAQLLHVRLSCNPV